MNSKSIGITGAALLISLTLAGCGAAVTEESQSQIESELEGSPSASATSSTAETTESTAATDEAVSTGSTYEDLQYLIEEEKLAHDVYSALYEVWGSKVFGNILESETTHQNRVAELLVAFDVEDPRVAEPGVFTDPELQDLYDQLVAKGLTSQRDAIEVGILIEEKDIADIQVQLDSVTDPEIVQVLESLLKGSENHLAAFTRQLR